MANDKKPVASENSKISTLDDAPDQIEKAVEATAVVGSNHDDAISGEKLEDNDL